MFDVTVVLLDDGLASTSIMPAEIFQAAGALWHDLHGRPAEPAFRVRMVSLNGKSVTSLYGHSLGSEGSLADIAQTDVIIVPTSGVELDAKLVENGELLPWLRQHHARGAYVVGVCMGVAYLAEAGLLDGRRATTHWGLSHEFRARYSKVRWSTDQFVTEDNRLICSGGVYAAVDASLYLVEKLCGHEVAVQTAKALLLPMPRLHQSVYAMQSVSRPHDNARIRVAEGFLHTHFQSEISNQMLAQQAGLGERTFVRHFKAATGLMPATYLQTLRVEAAKSMLERDNLSIHAISAEVGYEDVGFFRSVFKRIVGMTPREYRNHFAPFKVRGETIRPPMTPAQVEEGLRMPQR